MPANKRSRLPFLALAGVGLLAVAGGIAYLVLERSNPQGAIPLGANLIPQDALSTVSVTTDSRKWLALEQMGNAEAKKLIADTKTEWQQKFLTDRGLDYSRDIQPWVGAQITLAQLPITAATIADATTREEPKIWVLPIDKFDLAQQSVNRWGNLERRTYKDLEIRQTAANAAHPYGVVILDQKWVVLASVPAALDVVIDTYKGQPSLLQQPRYTQALAQIAASGQPFAQFYLNMAATKPPSQPGASPSASPSPEASPASPSPSPSVAVPATDLQGFAANLDVNENDRRLTFRSVSWHKQDLPAGMVAENRSQRLAELLPANTIALYTGSNFQQFWRSYNQGGKPEDTSPFAPGQIRDLLRDSAGLNFDQDLLPWMNGEFGAALLPGPKPTNPNLAQGSGLVLLAQTNDRGKAEKAMKQLDMVVQQKQQWLVTPVQVSNQKFTVWQVPPANVISHHGWLENNLLFMTMGSPVVTGFVPRPKDTLNRAALFQNVMRSDLQPHSGQIYLDMPQVLRVMDTNAQLPKLGADLRRYAQVMNGVGITSAARNNWSTRYDILVELLPKQ
jgi:hypothetical protein